MAENGDKFKVKLGSQGAGKIWKMHFGEYGVVSSKMGWTTGSYKSNLFNTKFESKSTQKFSFLLSNKAADSAWVSAANNIRVKALQEIQVYCIAILALNLNNHDHGAAKICFRIYQNV